MKRSKRLMIIVLCAVMTVIMSGCDGKKDNQANAGPQDVIYWSRPLGKVFQSTMDSLIAEYNALQSDYVIKVEWVQQSLWDEKVSAARASRTAPDMMNISYSWVNSNVTQGYILPLDDLLDKQVLADIVPGIDTKVTIGGKTYAMPLFVESSMLLFYRKDILGAAGYNEAPATWDELIRIAREVQTGDMFGLAVPYFGAGFAWGTWGMQYNLTGHRQITENWDAPAIDDYKPFYELFKRFYDEKVVPEQALAIYDSIGPFASGMVAMQLCGAWGIDSLLTTYADMEISKAFSEKVGIAAIPAFDNAVAPDVTASGGGWAVAIDAQSDAAQGAAGFISWLYDPEHPERMGQIAAGEGFCRAQPTKAVKAYVEAEAQQAKVDYLDIVNRVAATAINEPNYLYDIGTTIEASVQSYAMGYRDDLDEVLADCKSAIQQIIDSNRLAGANPEKPQQ